jgi:hypothetical protein
MEQNDTTTTNLPFAVNEWGSHPDEGNDDCWTGQDFATFEEARARFDELREKLADGAVELVGPGVHEVYDTGRRDKPEDSGSWQREMAMEAGMLHGVDAYNEMMGCDVGYDEY